MAFLCDGGVAGWSIGWLSCQAARGRIVAVDSGNLVSAAELFAGGDHPVGEVEHAPLEYAGSINTGYLRKLFESDLF